MGPAYLEYHNSTTFVAGCQQFTIVIKLNARNYIRVGNIIVQGTFDLWKTPRLIAIACRKKKKIIKNIKKCTNQIINNRNIVY